MKNESTLVLAVVHRNDKLACTYGRVDCFEAGKILRQDLTALCLTPVSSRMQRRPAIVVLGTNLGSGI